jgi:hypothetical protein
MMFKSCNPCENHFSAAHTFQFNMLHLNIPPFCFLNNNITIETKNP